MNRGTALPLILFRSVEKRTFFQHILGYRVGWGIIRDYLQKANTEEQTADFQPLSVHLLERLDKYRGQTTTFA